MSHPILPLVPNSRPALGARVWMEKLYQYAKAQSADSGMSFLEGWSAYITLSVVAHWMRKYPAVCQSRLRLGEDLKDLPWLTTPYFSSMWENEKIWTKNEHPQSYERIQFNALLEEGPISDAYSSKNELALNYLSKFLSHHEKASQEIDCSSYIWQDWLKTHPGYESFQKTRHVIEEFGKGLGLTATQARAWANIELWWSGASKAMPLSLNFLFSQCSEPKEWFELCAHAAGCSWEEMYALFIDDQSPLLKEVLYFRLKTTKAGPCFPGDKSSFTQMHQKWMHGSWAFHRKEIIDFQTPLWSHFKFNQISPKSDLDLSQKWSQLGSEWFSCVNALKHYDQKAALLIVAEPGQGKTELMMDLIASTQQHYFEVAGVDLSKEDFSSWHLMAKWVSACQADKPAILFIDDAENKLDGSSYRVIEERNCPVLMSVSDLKLVPENLRNQFDKIVFLNDMPIATRREYAKQFFEDEVLALRVARMVKSPSQIEEVANWCEKTQQYDLNTVLSFLHSKERARQLSSYTMQFEVEPSPALDELPPMVCSQELHRLMHRLIKIFEHPDRFEKLGGQAPKGALLIGPPGTGKTLFARHLASHLKLPLIAPDCMALYKNPANIANLFQCARQQSPCVLLLDEAALLLSPQKDAVHAMLAQLDGVDSLEGVFIVATTNSPFVHSSIKRPGRLSEIYTIQHPFEEERVQIWSAYLKDKPLEEDVLSISQQAAKSSQGMTGAEIQEALRKAGTEAVLADEIKLSLDRIIRACDEVQWSPASGQDPILPEHRWRLALHEAGHALMTWRWKKEVARITVRARDGALGMVMFYDIEKDHEMSRQSLLGHAQIDLGGIAAEEAILGEYTNGGSADLEALYHILSRGLKVLGYGGFGAVNAGNEALWSDQRRRQFEAEVDLWARHAFEEAVQWFKHNRIVLENLANDLLKFIDMSSHELTHHQKAVHEIAHPLPQAPSRLKLGGVLETQSRPVLMENPNNKQENNTHTLHQSSTEPSSEI